MKQIPKLLSHIYTQYKCRYSDKQTNKLVIPLRLSCIVSILDWLRDSCYPDYIVILGSERKDLGSERKDWVARENSWVEKEGETVLLIVNQIVNVYEFTREMKDTSRYIYNIK